LAFLLSSTNLDEQDLIAVMPNTPCYCVDDGDLQSRLLIHIGVVLNNGAYQKVGVVLQGLCNLLKRGGG